MDVNVLKRQFARIGARAQVRWVEPGRQRVNRQWTQQGPVALDIIRDDGGELFDIRLSKEAPAEVEILQTEPQLRHLLLLARDPGGEKHKFLCGHDERHWFVAAVPERRPVSTVRTAMEALKPQELVHRQDHLRIRSKNRNRRRNEAFVRQGEWFFVPEPELVVDEKIVLRSEPLRRGNGKPHTVEFLCRTGGETVYVCDKHPLGLTEGQYGALVSRKPEARNWPWRTWRRNPSVYVKGRVRHADHATIVLDGWHRVLMNTESQSVAMQHVAFLD